jgi:acid phosphatase (class A)
VRPSVPWAAVALALLIAPGSHAGAPARGYLDGAPIGYAVPPAPTDPLVIELDLVQVLSQRPAPTSARWLEAATDADAYDAPDIIRRFDDASGRILDEPDRPLLVAMLGKLITDAETYAGVAKADNSRPRPYVEDPSITPCNTHYLAGTERKAYPSGHAMNGYVVALALSAVFPASRPAILARGVRYGDNRVACGVHHPLDVEEGRRLAIAYFAALRSDPAFQADLACAQAEEALVSQKAPLPAACAASRAAILKVRASRGGP